MLNRDAMHEADRHMAEHEDHIHEYDMPRRRMGAGQLFSAGVLVGATSYIAYHILRFVIHNKFYLIQN